MSFSPKFKDLPPYDLEEFQNSLQAGQLLSELFDNIPSAHYFVKDRHSRFMGGNQSFADALGEPSVDAIIGKTDYDYSPDFMANAFYADDQQVLSSGQPLRHKIELISSPDGSLDWLCTTKIPLRGQDGTVVGLAGVARIIQDSDSLYAGHPEMYEIVNFVKTNFRNKLSVSDMAKVGGISVSSQERLFRKTFGLTPLMYLRRTRLNAACKLLRETKNELSKIAIECGFNDQTNMTRAFRLELKITPLRYRRRFSDISHPTPQRRKLRTLRAAVQ